MTKAPWRLALLPLLFLMAGCSGMFTHYDGVERSLHAGLPEQAVELIQEFKDNYGEHNRLLYLLDHGMALHLAGRYHKSNGVLEEAHLLVEEQYTTRFRDEASALLLNETQLPYTGEPFEHVLINVIKSLNFALLGHWNDALVEARRIDHRLNVLSDRAERDAYKEDPFARYLTGMLYEITGDMNNAYVAYRKAEAVYEEARAWSQVPLPNALKADLIRVTGALHLPEAREWYAAKYPEVRSDAVLPHDADEMAQLIVVSYHGRSPHKEDVFIDVPISLDALYLVGLTKSTGLRSTRSTRGGESVLYGIHGRIARVALPRLVHRRSTSAYRTIELRSGTSTFSTRSQRLYHIGAVAEKNLDDGYNNLVLRAVARAAMKMGAAEGIGIGVSSAVQRSSHDWIGLLALILARIFALATEEADIRSWRTLPAEIQVARVWIPAGSYHVTMNTVDRLGRNVGLPETEQLDFHSGEVRVLLRQYAE